MLLTSALCVALTATPKPRVLVDATDADLTVLTGALLKDFLVVPARSPLGESPGAKALTAACAADETVAVLSPRHAPREWQVHVFNCEDGAALETVAVRSATGKPPAKLPAAAMKKLRGELARGRRALPPPPPPPPPAAEAAVEPAPGTPPIEAPPPPRPEAPAAAVATTEPAAATPQPPPPTPTPTPASDATATAPPPPPEPAPSTPSPAVVAAPAPGAAAPAEVKAEASEPAPPPVAVRAGVAYRTFIRSLSWEQEGDSLASYSMPGASAVAVEAQWFPGAHLTTGMGANFGAWFQGDFGLGLTSRRNGVVFPTGSSRLRAGGLFRLPVGSTFEADLSGGYLAHAFTIAPRSVDGQARPTIPGVTYAGPRVGLGLRLLGLGRVNLELGAAATFLTGTGELGSAAFFPNARGFAVDANAGLGVRLVEAIEARLTFDYAHYFLSLEPSRTAALQAERSTDLYLGGTLGLVWVM